MSEEDQAIEQEEPLPEPVGPDQSTFVITQSKVSLRPLAVIVAFAVGVVMGGAAFSGKDQECERFAKLAAKQAQISARAFPLLTSQAENGTEGYRLGLQQAASRGPFIASQDRKVMRELQGIQFDLADLDGDLKEAQEECDADG